jgi:hypothetical protein
MESTRPAMPPLKPGDRLTVRHNQRYARVRDGEFVVIRVGRKWAYLVAADDRNLETSLAQGEAWNETKIDKQSGYMDGGQYSSPGRAYTDEQLAWDERRKSAEEYIRATLCNPYHLKERWGEDRYVELANLLRRHGGLEEL